MKLFLREHLSFVIFSLLQSFFILFVCYLYMLEQKLTPTPGIFAYTIAVSFLLHTLFLAARYLRQRENYEILSLDNHDLDLSIKTFSNSPLFEAFQKTIHKQYHLYINELQKLRKEANDHSLFINQWAHQMKTPLSVIDLLLQNYEVETERDREFVNSMHEELERLQHGLELMLYSERMKQFTHDFRVKRVSLKLIVHDVVHHYKRVFIRNRIYPTVDIAQAIFVETDEKWLKFALSQIVTNAIKYSKGENKKIIISAVQEQNQVALTIKDFGVGIPKQDIGRVFELFFTGINGRRFAESTGMGLYLVKQIFDRLGHGITISSEEGKGTKVTITFYNVTKM
jgi:two-component system, OmpR family, sensor histidine kinase YxdK